MLPIQEQCSLSLHSLDSNKSSEGQIVSVTLANVLEKDLNRQEASFQEFDAIRDSEKDGVMSRNAC